MNVERGVELARYTTLGIGGPAAAFARPESTDDVREALGWAAAEGLPVTVIGLGSNLLVADAGVDALVLKLSGDLATAEIRGESLVAGGGAANAVCLHRARDAGLGGFEFAAAIPGTIGGGVRMNAGAWGGEFAQVLREVEVVDRDGVRVVPAAELDLSYRHSNLGSGQVVTSAVLQLRRRPVEEIRVEVRELNEQRKAMQPTDRRTFGSVWKNPDHELGAGQMLEACGLRGHRIGGAEVSPRHANFIENTGGATAADVIALMVEARRRAYERFGVVLEHEVQLLGPIELPPLQDRPAAPRSPGDGGPGFAPAE